MRSRRSILIAAISLALAASNGRAQDMTEVLDLLGHRQFQAAMPILKELAEHGNADAQAYYGALLLIGEGGLAVDLQEGRRWMRMAAIGGNWTAAFDLGLMAEQGDGMDVDRIEALRWYILAASAGLPVAMLKAGQGSREGWSGTVDLGAAARWLRSAAQAGDPDAQNLYAVMIASKEIGGSMIEAYALFKVAGRNGQPDAYKNLELLRPQLSAADVDAAERQAENWLTASRR